MSSRAARSGESKRLRPRPRFSDERQKRDRVAPEGVRDRIGRKVYRACPGEAEPRREMKWTIGNTEAF